MLIRFGANGEKSEKKTYEIPLAIMNQYASAGNRRENMRKDDKGEAEVEHMRLQAVFVRGDGVIVLVGEKQFTSGSATRRGSTATACGLPGTTPVEIWRGPLHSYYYTASIDATIVSNRLIIQPFRTFPQTSKTQLDGAKAS